MNPTRRTNPALVVDWTRCDGHGLCAAVLPTLIGRDEWGFPIIASQTSGVSTGDLRRAVTLCPALALRLSNEPAPRHP